MGDPWLVLLPEKLLASSETVLLGSVDPQRKVVRVAGHGERVGEVKSGMLKMEVIPSSAPLHVLLHDPKLFSRLLTSSCISCRRHLLGDRLCEAVKEPDHCSCQRPSEQTGNGWRLFRCSYLCRVLRRRYWELSVDSSSASADILLDFLLGFLLVLLFKTLMTDETVTWAAMRTSQGVAVAVDVLQRLIVWLMGAPIGLKVNKNLSWALGQFYLYHVSLWSNYISALVIPFLTIILSSFGYVALAGLSTFLALTLDVLNLLVVHLSCFYIYACKLYRLQTVVLYSLWCLFRGKKWNPLRQRIDTAPFQMDRLFVGVLFFSMTVFLLPTTASFYVVFTTVRLAILIIQGLICRPILFVLGLPVLPLVAWMLNSASVCDTVRVQLMRAMDKQLILRMQITRKDLMTFYREQRWNVDAMFGETYSISAMIKRIIGGDVLYP